MDEGVELQKHLMGEQFHGEYCVVFVVVDGHGFSLSGYPVEREPPSLRTQRHPMSTSNDTLCLHLFGTISAESVPTVFRSEKPVRHQIRGSRRRDVGEMQVGSNED
jgi:hypothetical protein